MAGKGQYDPQDKPLRATIDKEEPYENGGKVQGVNGRAEDQVLHNKWGVQDSQVSLISDNLEPQSLADQPDPIPIKANPPPQDVKVLTGPGPRHTNEGHKVGSLQEDWDH